MHRGEDTDRGRQTATGNAQEKQEGMENQNTRHNNTQHKDINLEP